MRTDTDTAWMTGLFEGEGSFVTLDVQRANVRLTMEMSMTDFDIVRRFHQLADIGSVCYVTPRAGHQPQFKWAANGLEALQLAVKMLPLLGQRRSSKVREWIKVAAQFKITPGRWAERQQRTVDFAKEVMPHV